jgi:glycine/D-amino acid oxidase-like deaminating enzyme
MRGEMTKRRSILIVGGGTAGWMTAAYLAKVFGRPEQGGVPITLIESPDIGTIGVGEGSFATIRTTLSTLGIDEARFLREATATFKQGVRFVDWEKTPVADAGGTVRHQHYFHPFDPPMFAEGAGLLPYWLLQDPKTRAPFAEAVTFQKRVAEAARAPKRIHEGGYAGPLNYAYHFDSANLGKLLAAHARSLGVRHLAGRIDGVELSGDGSIGAVVSPEHGRLTADLYIDCTGFRAELIGKALKSPYTSVGHQLLTDRALAVQIPDDGPDARIESYTVSTAHEAGWTWDIGLNNRRGIGYVYSSNHSSDDRAAEVLRGYLGPKHDGLEPRLIRFDTGYRQKQWIRNCVAVGLSGGFFEPLEATGIMMIEVAIALIVDLFAHTGPMDASARVFNERITQRNEKIVNFLKLHYCITKRQEPFWRDNADPRTIPDELGALLDMWRYRPPSRFDFLDDIDTFSFFNYQYILYGMNFETDYEAARGSFPAVEAAERAFARVRAFAERAVQDLPSHRNLIHQVYTLGFTDRQAVSRAGAPLGGGPFA